MDGSMAASITGVATWLTTMATTIAVPVCACAVSWGGLKWLTGGGGVKGSDEGKQMIIRYGSGFLICLGATMAVGELRDALGLAQAANLLAVFLG